MYDAPSPGVVDSCGQFFRGSEYRDGVDRNSWPLGIRPADLATVAIVIAVIELNVTVGGGAGAAPLNAEAYILGAVITLPLLLRRRWPLQVLWVSFAAMILYYTLDRRNISPAPLMALPVYDAALAGYLAWAIGLPALIMTLGLIVVGLFGNDGAIVTLANFLPSFAIFILAVTLGEVVRGRRALAAETARRLRLAEDERKSEAARLVAEERLRIARELHDTVAHSMATITVQAGSALHVLSKPLSPNGSSRLSQPPPPPPDAQKLQDALLAIRETSKSALAEMRSVLGQLRGDPGDPGAQSAADDGALGLSRLPELRDAVTAAGSPVTVTVEGAQAALPPAADHAAYRILQESLTNVLRHAAPGTPADVRLRYEPEQLTITVANRAERTSAPGAGNGTGRSDGAGWSGGTGRSDGAGWLGGNGIRGMRERTATVGGTLEAGPTPGGFAVTATIPWTAS
jgi:signal transduction histidine kinase